MHLSLLEQAVDVKPETLGESGSVFVNSDLVVAQVGAEVEAVVRCCAYAAQARGKRVTESVLIQQGRMQGTHDAMFSMAQLGQRASICWT